MNIALIYDNNLYQNDTAMLLDDAGYTVNLSFSTDSTWYAAVLSDRPDVLVISISAPGKVLLDQLEKLKEETICPVIVIAHECSQDVTNTVIQAGADTCVTGDISIERIQSLIQNNLARFKVRLSQIEEIKELNKTVESLEARLNDRKDIEKAKGLLMNSYRMNEDDAYKALRRMAMDTGNKLGEVARNLISMSKVLN